MDTTVTDIHKFEKVSKTVFVVNHVMIELLAHYTIPDAPLLILFFSLGFLLALAVQMYFITPGGN